MPRWIAIALVIGIAATPAWAQDAPPSPPPQGEGEAAPDTASEPPTVDGERSADDAESDGDPESEPTIPAPVRAPESSIPLEIREALAPSSQTERRVAVGMLKELPSDEALERLAFALRLDPDPETRALAARALAVLGTPAARDVLTAALETEPDNRVGEVIREVRDGIAQPEEPGRTLILIGGILGLLAYIPTVLAGFVELVAGAVDHDDDMIRTGWQLLIPVAGPVLALYSGDGTSGEAGPAMAYMSGLFQAAGIGCVIAGLVRLVRYRLHVESVHMPQQERTAGVVPIGGPQGIGLAGWW